MGEAKRDEAAGGQISSSSGRAQMEIVDRNRQEYEPGLRL